MKKTIIACTLFMSMGAAGITQVVVPDYSTLSTVPESLYAIIDLKKDRSNITTATKMNASFMQNNSGKYVASILLELSALGVVDSTLNLLVKPPKVWHAIAWFPLQDDLTTNPATLDTLSNGAEEVYNFIDDDALVNTWLTPSNFTQVDSIVLWTSTSSTAGDSGAFDVGFSVSSAFGDTTTPLLTTNVSDTVDMGTSNDKFVKFVFSGWTGIDIDANELVRVACIRDTNITNNLSRTTPIRLHYTEIYWQ